MPASMPQPRRTVTRADGGRSSDVGESHAIASSDGGRAAVAASSPRSTAARDRHRARRSDDGRRSARHLAAIAPTRSARAPRRTSFAPSADGMQLTGARPPRALPRRADRCASCSTARRGRCRARTGPCTGRRDRRRTRASPTAARCSTSPATSSPSPTSSATSTTSRCSSSTTCTCTSPTTRAGASQIDALAAPHRGRRRATPVGGGGGGFYTQADYARDRRLRGRAASSRSCPRSTCPGTPTPRSPPTPSSTATASPPEPYTGIEVGFSTLASTAEATYDVPRRRARASSPRMTPGPVPAHRRRRVARHAPTEDFSRFVAPGDAAIGAEHRQDRHRLARDGPSRRARRPARSASTGASSRRRTTPRTHALLVRRAGRQRHHVPRRRRLPRHEVRRLTTRLGLAWADGPTSVARRTRGTRPRSSTGVGEEHILGVEAPLWTETLATIDDVEFMAFPRIAVDRRDRLVARTEGWKAGLGRVRPAGGRPVQPARGARRRLLPRARAALGLSAPPPSHPRTWIQAIARHSGAIRAFLPEWRAIA